MDKALADEQGARFKVDTIEEATHQRTRIHYARKLHRDENAKSYEPGHKMHGRSAYDVLVCRIKNVDGAIYIYLERTDVVSADVEPLSTLTPKQLEHTPVRQIEHKSESVPADLVAGIVARRV